MADLLGAIKQRYYNASTGPSDLIDELIKSLQSPSVCDPSSGKALYEYLGDSRRENNIEAHADPVEHRGILVNEQWVIGSNKTHITPLECMDQIGEEANLTPPEMVFGSNQLVLFHKPTGFCYAFLAVEALKGAHFPPPASDQAADIVAQQQLKVHVAKNTASTDDVKELDISYDWTYTTDYKGNLQRLIQQAEKATWERKDDIRVETTTQRIDLAKLKEREPILWFDEVDLFEDELHDHGISIMSIKVRVMPSGFYVLARYWLRLDHVVVRLHESRIHHLFGTDYLLREYTRKEETFENLFAKGHPRGMANYTNIDTFQQHLPVREAMYEKIFLA